jgi:hypothetical protein
MTASFKDFIFQVYNLGMNKGNFQEYWDRWDGSEELMESIEQYLDEHLPPATIPTLIYTNSIVQEVQPWNNSNPW